MFLIATLRLARVEEVVLSLTGFGSRLAVDGQRLAVELIVKGIGWSWRRCCETGQSLSREAFCSRRRALA